MDQSKDEEEKEGKLMPQSDIEPNSSSPMEDGVHRQIEADYIKGTKRSAEMPLVAPKPKIKKKLHTVISELKTSKESNPFFEPIAEGRDLNLASPCSSTPESAFDANLFPTKSPFTESNDPIAEPSDLQKQEDKSVILSTSKQYAIGEYSDSSVSENIYRPKLLDSLSASVSPKVKCKAVNSPSSSFHSDGQPLVTSAGLDDESDTHSSKRIKLSSTIELSPEESCETSDTGNNYDANRSSPLADHQDEDDPKISYDDDNVGAVSPEDNSSGLEKPDYIPVAKVDPLMESTAQDEDSQTKDDSDGDSERSAKEKTDSGNEDSDSEDESKSGLMGGSTGLSARPKVKNMRKNIRDIMADDKLEEDTLAAQKEEQLRLQRLQEKRIAMREYLEQQQVERMVAEVAEAAEAVTAAEAVQEVEQDDDSRQAEPIPEVKKEPLEEEDDDVVVLSSEDSDDSDSKDSEPDEEAESNNESKAITLPNLLKPKIEVKSEKDSQSETEESESDSDSDVVVLSHSEDEADTDEDVTNCGAHVNDDFNAADVNGRVLVNVGHPEKEEDIFLAPQLATAVKPHQIGGLRFLYDNIVESLEQFKTSNGFGCILAHSMGLGKTLQVISLTDVFLRHTGSTSVLIIVPINTLQNWVTEYNYWLPDEKPAGLSEETEYRPRNFKVYLLNDGQKSIKARAKVIDDWSRQGGVLLMGYEMYRQLSLKKPKKPKKKKRKNHSDIVDIEEEDSNKEYLDEIHKALVRPGPDLIICDEGHRIKNAHANISQALKSIRTKRRVVLTGYPLQNNLLEYWCMVDFVRPNYLGTKTEFMNMFERPIQNGQCVDSTPQDVKLMRYRAHVLHSLLEGFVQRRGHSVLAATLPTKHEHVILCRLTPIQRKLYTAYMAELTVNKGMANPLKAFAICCKIWNHPDILYNLVMKRLNEDLDLDLDEVVGKPGAKAKKVAPAKAAAADKRKVAKPVVPPNWNPPMESKPAPNGSLVQSSNSSDTGPPNMPPGFQPNAMGPPQMMPQHQNSLQQQQQQQQQRMPLSNNTNEHSNVNMGGYPYPNMYNMQPQTPYMNQMHYPWSYNQGYPPDTNAPYMPPYNMYPPQYTNAMQQSQQELPPYQMPPPGHMPGMSTTNQGCAQQMHDQRNTSEHGEGQNRQQNGGSMTERSLEAMETSSLAEEQGTIKKESQLMSVPHLANSANNSHLEQNLANNMNLPQDMRPVMGNQLVMQDPNCKFNYMSSPSPKISDQMNNLALEHKDFNAVNRNMLEECQSRGQGTHLQPNFAPKEETRNYERSQESNERIESDREKKDDIKKEEVSLEWAESYFKDYIPGLLETSTKFQIFFQILQGSLAVGDRILVFSQSLFTLSQLEEFLQKTVIPGTTEKWAKNRTYFRLDGSTASQERDKLITEFNNNPIVRLFLVSTRAGSLGINLVGANRVVVFDASFNPCHDTQAVCRVYRYGQHKDCHIYRMVTDNSLERRIYDRQVNKQGISDRIVDEMNPEAHLSSKEISNLLVEKEEEPSAEDFADKSDDLTDPIFKDIVKEKSHLLTRPPFRHESLLVDGKDKKLSNAEKRLAKRSYELEKQANISYNRPSYSSFYPKTAGIGTAVATKIGGVVYAKPVGTVRPMQADGRHRIEGGMLHRPNILSRTPNTPVESLAKQGVSVQQITIPKDVSIPTNSGDAKAIQLRAGQSVMVIKTQKGMYLRLSDGKIVAIRIPPGNEDAFGLPLSQGSVTIVPSVYQSRGRPMGAARGSGSIIRRGRPPLSAQYALGQVVPKGINKSQMAVRIIRNQTGVAGRGKPTYQQVAVPVSNKGTLLNKSVVITPAKSGPKVTAKDAKMSPKVQITAVPAKPGGLASIGGTSGLNRRLNRNNKLLFQQATSVKTDDPKKQPMAGTSDEDRNQTDSAKVDGGDRQLLAPNSESSSDDGETTPYNELSPKGVDFSSLGNTSIEKPAPMIAEETQNVPATLADALQPDNLPVKEDPPNVMAKMPDRPSIYERNSNLPSEFIPPDKNMFAAMGTSEKAISNAKADSVPDNMLNPLSQLSNLLPPDDREAQSQMSGAFNTMPQTSQRYSQPVYSNHQLFQPYLQQSAPPTSSGPSHVSSITTTSDPSKPWPKLGDELIPSSNDPIHSRNNLKAPSNFLPPQSTSHYQNSTHLERQAASGTTYQQEGSQIQPQSAGNGQRSAEGQIEATNTMGQVLNQATPAPLPNDNALSLSNLLPDAGPSDIPGNSSAPIDYMNYSSAFSRLEYPSGEVPTTSEMGVPPAAPPYSSAVATPSPSFPTTNPPPYSQYPGYANHSFRTPAINPPGYPYVRDFVPYGHYGGLCTQGQPQPPPVQQQYPGMPTQENYNYNSGSLPPYTPGIGNFGQGPYPPM